MDDNENDVTTQPGEQLADAETILDGPRERLAAAGAAALADADLLALLLGTPSTDLAAAVLNRVGGLRGLAQASDIELRSAARGIGAVRAATIQAAIELGRRCVGERPVRGQRLGCASEVWEHYRARLATSAIEEFWALALDVRHRVINDRCIARGTLTGVDVHPRDVFRGLIRESAAGVIFCHNHPSGSPDPSRQDVELTARLRQTGELCGIVVLDHVVVASEGYVSLAERGWA